MQAVLDDHRERHPRARLDRGDLAVAAAEIDGAPATVIVALPSARM
jgi:hypothetical protein